MWFWSNIVYIAPALGSCVSVRHAELTTVAEMWQWLIGEQLALVYHYHKGYLNYDTILTGFHYMVHNQYFTQELFVSLFFVGYFNLFFLNQQKSTSSYLWYISLYLEAIVWPTSLIL